MSATLKSPISWPGGKAKIAHEIIALIPEHKSYVEPFGGGAAVMLAKDRSKHEVYNDIDGDLVRFFRCAKYHRDALIDEIDFVPNAEQELKDFLAQPGLTDIQRAARWFVRNKISFGGRGESFGTGKTGGGASHGSRANRLELIRKVNARLDSVCIRNMPALDCIKQYATPATVFFVDPPYINGFAYGRLFTKDDHTAIRDVLFESGSYFIVTYDDHPFVHELYKGCVFQKTSTPMGIGNNHAGKPGKRSHLEQVIITPGKKRSKVGV